MAIARMLVITDKHLGIWLVSALPPTHQQTVQDDKRRVLKGEQGPGRKEGRGALGLAAEIATTYVKYFMMN